MQYLDLSDYSDRIIVCGDIHGEFETLVYEIGRHQITDAIVIVAGDCGFGFSRPTYYDDLYTRKMHKKLEKANVLLLMVRGNHDDPVFFEKELIDYPYMKALPDYTIVHTQSHNVLCVGGAVSVDRNFRLSLMSLPRKNKMPLWWKEEPFVFKEEELLELEKEHLLIDTVVTHTCPAFCPPEAKADEAHFCANDDNLEEDLKKERKDVTALYNWLKAHNHHLHSWYYGHFHNSGTIDYEGVLFHLLNINELKEIPNTY